MYVFIKAEMYNLYVFQRLKQKLLQIKKLLKNVKYLQIFCIIKIFVSKHFFDIKACIGKQF